MESTNSMDLFNQNLHLMEDSKKLQLAKECKVEGVECYKNKELKEAFLKFSIAVKYLVTILSKQDGKEVNPLEGEKLELLALLYNNLANCHLVKGNYEHAADMASSVLERDPDNVKALFRRGSAYIEIQEYERARSDLNKLLELEPGNKLAKARQTVLNEKVRNFDKECAVAMKKLFC